MDRGYDDVWNSVGFVKCRYGRDEGGEGGDCMAGKDSVFAVRQWGFWWNMEGGGGGCYSASNWLGRIKSASRSRFL